MSGLDGLGWPTDDDDDDDFLYGVGEGSYIDRVPVAVKVRNQTTVLDQPQDLNECLRSDDRGLGVKFSTFVIAIYMRFRGIRG